APTGTSHTTSRRTNRIPFNLQVQSALPHKQNIGRHYQLTRKAALAQRLRTQSDWGTNNPQQAALDFVAENKDFAIVEPEWPFNEGQVRNRITYWPGAFIKRLR
ncbi:MAG: hypothetical protein KGQ37_11680, partial [Hyphomicrobiales bacterium]|nr:hypothetical protein [Hyphomicrobiales bacterium]